MKPLKEIVAKAIEGTVWDYSNQILYDMCLRRFDHNDTENILAKIWIIGRTYAATIERRKNKTVDEDSEAFAVKKVAPIIKRSKLDEALLKIRRLKSFNCKTAIQILKVHKLLQEVFYKISGQGKRSLASKYLHFHLPDLFYIYDSRASKEISKYVKIGKGESQEVRDLIDEGCIDKEYSIFCLKAKKLSDQIEDDFGVAFSPRQLDNFLLFYSREMTAGV